MINSRNLIYTNILDLTSKLEDFSVYYGVNNHKDLVLVTGGYHARKYFYTMEQIFDDYNVIDEGCVDVESTKIYRQYMLNKFGEQYREDCFNYTIK